MLRLIGGGKEWCQLPPTFNITPDLTRLILGELIRILRQRVSCIWPFNGQLKTL